MEHNNHLYFCTVCGFCFVLQRTCTGLKNTFMIESSPLYLYKNPSLRLLILVLYLRDKFWKTQTRLTEFSRQPTDSRKFFWMLFLGISFKSLHQSAIPIKNKALSTDSQVPVLHSDRWRVNLSFSLILHIMAHIQLIKTFSFTTHAAANLYFPHPVLLYYLLSLNPRN